MKVTMDFGSTFKEIGQMVKVDQEQLDRLRTRFGDVYRLSGEPWLDADMPTWHWPVFDQRWRPYDHAWDGM